MTRMRIKDGVMPHIRTENRFRIAGQLVDDHDRQHCHCHIDPRLCGSCRLNEIRYIAGEDKHWQRLAASHVLAARFAGDTLDDVIHLAKCYGAGYENLLPDLAPPIQPTLPL